MNNIIYGIEIFFLSRFSVFFVQWIIQNINPLTHMLIIICQFQYSDIHMLLYTQGIVAI